MYSLISSALSCVRESIPDIDAYVIKLDLDFMTIIVHPMAENLICISNDGTSIDWFNIIGFYLELTERKDFVNILFAACFFDEDNKLITQEMTFNGIKMTHYRVSTL
jgi:hypothetical protein